MVVWSEDLMFPGQGGVREGTFRPTLTPETSSPRSPITLHARITSYNNCYEIVPIRWVRQPLSQKLIPKFSETNADNLNFSLSLKSLEASLGPLVLSAPNAKQKTGQWLGF